MNTPITFSPHQDKDGNKPVNLLWTGGWDSTFRLLQLLLEKKTMVQPYYIIDYRRPSLGMEFETMQYLRSRITEIYPQSANLFLPTKHSDLESIKPDIKISESYKKIVAIRHLGDQYEWLPRFCKQHKVRGMELCIEKLTQSSNLSLLPYLTGIEKYPNFNKPDYYDTIKKEINYIFSFFELPLIYYTKTDMYEYATKKKWVDEVLTKTWFCYYPSRLKSPCGLCKPCVQAITNHFGWRIPLCRRVLYYMRKYKRNVWPERF